MEENAVRHALQQLHARPIAFYPAYAKLMGSTAGGVILSQILYWASVSSGEFWKTDADLREETGCSERELREAKSKLAQLDFVRIEVKGLPARTFYFIDWAGLVAALQGLQDVDSSDEPDMGCTNQFGQGVRTSSDRVYELVRTGCTNYTCTYREYNREYSRENLIFDYADSLPTDPPDPPPQEPPPRKPRKPNYYVEVREAFRAVLGNEWKEDPLAVRSCLAAWSDVRKRGTSAEEIVSLWRDARAKAQADWRDRITLLWVLNNAEKARRMVAYSPKSQQRVPSYYRPVVVPETWGRLQEPHTSGQWGLAPPSSSA